MGSRNKKIRESLTVEMLKELLEYNAETGKFYCYGYWPESIDHINGDPSDNRIENLREVDQGENTKNMGRTHTNKTGISGVYWCNDREKWTAKISVNNKTKCLGRFDDFFEACCARKSADVKYNFHENHGRR